MKTIKDKHIFYKAIRLFILFAIGTNTSFAQVDSAVYQQVQHIIENIRKEQVPDGRTKILEFTEPDAQSNRYTIHTSDSDIKEHLENALASVQGDFDIVTLPEKSLGDSIYGLVNLSVANLRTRPSHAAEMATQLLLGAQVDILQKEGGDYRVRTPEGYIAWTPSSSIVPLNATQLKEWKESPKLIYTAEFGRSYSQTDTKSQRVSDLVYGDLLRLQGEEDEFYRVSYPDGRIAFIPKDQATDFEQWLGTRQATAENILNSAKTMMGLPYLWGGTSVKGVDCSGFTKTSFFMNGYVIPRDASQQVLYGQEVDILDEKGDFSPEKAIHNLQPADLLFFAGGKNTSPNPRVTHVALYIGDGEFIHAAGTVRINSMLKQASNYDDFQTRTVVAARRYLGVKDSAIQKVEENHYYGKN